LDEFACMFKTGTRKSYILLPEDWFPLGLLQLISISSTLRVSSLFKAEFAVLRNWKASAGAFLKSADFKILKPLVSIFKKFWYF